MDTSIAESRTVSASPAATERLAATLGARSRAGDRIWLRGEMGGGKTTFVRGFVSGLGHPEPREGSSPTFALHHRYEGGRMPVDHVDLYRFGSHPDDPGLAMVLEPLRGSAGVLLVEWPEVIENREPPPDLEIAFRFEGERRRLLTLRATGPGGRRLLGLDPAGDLP